MNIFVINALKFARKINSKLFGTNEISGLTNKYHEFTGEDVSRIIYDKLNSDNSLMVARFGAVEIECLATFISRKETKKKYIKYIQGKIHHFWWDRNTISSMSNNAGFFPSNPEMLERFSNLMMEDMKYVDILGSWQKKEILFESNLKLATKVPLNDLEPFRHGNPWSSALEGKKVLVIHPFEDSIKSQYSKRHYLFKNKKVLPQFELKTIKAIQSIANNKTIYNNWFEALNSMKEKISNIDFDIAIIGCGAYGFPLAAHVKRLGKKSIHLGGATQILFGIIGNRWEKEQQYKFLNDIRNEYWSRPLPNETPENSIKIEDSCYW